MTKVSLGGGAEVALWVWGALAGQGEELGPGSQGIWTGPGAPLSLSFPNPALPAPLGMDREVLS